LTDEVTGLLNRKGIEEVLAKYADKHVGVVFIDVDSLLRINDQYGHEVGTAVLVELALRVARVLPPECVLGRYGGDQFVVFLPGTDVVVVVQSVAVSLLRTCDAPIVVDNVTLDVRFSIGLGIAPPGDLRKGIGDADVAMYEAKSRGRARAVCLTPEWEAN
jgi:c-di-GMP phosphodiesterase